MIGRAVATLLAIAMAAVLLPTASASGGAHLVSTGLAYTSTVQQDGELGLFFLQQPAETKAGLPWLDLTASKVHAVEWSQEYDEADAAGTPTQGPANDPVATPSDLSDAHVSLKEAQGLYEVHVYSADGSTLPFHVDTDQSQMRSGTAAMCLGTYEDAGAKQCAVTDDTRHSPTFSTERRDGDWAVNNAAHGVLTTHGDLVIEVVGLTFTATSSETQTLLESGTWRTPLAGAPPASMQYAYHVRHVFLRLEATQATLEVGTQGGEADLFWAASHVTSQSPGQVTLTDVVLDANTHQARYTVPADRVLDIVPKDQQRLDIAVRGPSAAPLGTMAHVASPASAALVGTGAVMALSIAVGLGVARKLLRLPALADVETAIEEGEYRRAARMAARILARLPGSEEALLGRAIALSKAGQPQAAVDEISRHLAERPASDGALHYVLGLAQLEVGQAEDGRRSLQEAVRRTPALHDEVAPRLGKAFSVPSSTPKESHGYA